MPLDKIAIDILRLLAAHRDPESYVAGSTPLIRAAIRRLREEEEKLAAMRAALKVGDDQFDKGQRVPYASDLVNRAAKKAKENARRGRKV